MLQTWCRALMLQKLHPFQRLAHNLARYSSEWSEYFEVSQTYTQASTHILLCNYLLYTIL